MFKGDPIQLPLWKRGIDIVCCLIALPFFAVIAAMMALILKIWAPGPIFFKQERVGFRGKRFMCYKFRTMYLGADTKNHQAYLNSLITANPNAPMVKLDAKGDSRVIPGGWILRATGLDELPQIINIFRREMSIVGPRPCIPYEYERYSSDQKGRLEAVPGLTGLWQVSGKNRTTFDEMIRLDIQYANENSFWMDIRIIFMTVPALLIQLADTRRARKAKAESPVTIQVASPDPSSKRGARAAVL